MGRRLAPARRPPRRIPQVPPQSGRTFSRESSKEQKPGELPRRQPRRRRARSIARRGASPGEGGEGARVDRARLLRVEPFGSRRTLDFYYGTLSGNSARSAFALAEAGVAYTPHPIASPDSENRRAAYLELNPMGKVPALVDGDVRLWESNAINWYVAETHPAARLLPASVAGRASVQRWLMFQTGHVTPACRTIFRHTNPRVRAFWRTDVAPEAVEAAREELARYLPVLDRALAGRDWLEGVFSLADVAYAPHFAQLAEGGFDFAPAPNVRAWVERLWSRPAWRTAATLSLSGAV